MIVNKGYVLHKLTDERDGMCFLYVLVSDVFNEDVPHSCKQDTAFSIPSMRLDIASNTLIIFC